jgi:hypothetical protein
MQKHIKTVFLGVLLTAALTAPLSAQELPAQELPAQDLSAGEWIFISWTTGGSEAERAYFDSHLPDAVKANGWVLASTMEESDLFITTDLAYNYEMRLQAVTVQLHDSVTGEQLASNAMGYETVTDMNQWNNLLIEELMDGIPKYGHTVRGAGAGAGVVYSSELTWAERLWGREHYWLHLAPRVGGDLRFYSPMASGNTTGFTFDAGIQAMVQVLPFLGFQVELLFTMDFAPQFNITDGHLTADAKSTTSSLMIPVVFMITFRPDEWLIGPFAGLCINIPLGPMKLEIVSGDANVPSDSSYKWDSGGLGWTAGIEVGRKVGPGTLFADIRFIGDFGDIVSDMTPENSPPVTIKYRRTGVSVSLGYSFALGKKAAKAN